jgi:hypothetical protein
VVEAEIVRAEGTGGMFASTGRRASPVPADEGRGGIFAGRDGRWVVDEDCLEECERIS